MYLYGITEALMKLQALLEDPEVDQQLVEDCINDYTEELEVKADGYAKVIKNLEGNVDVIDKEIKRLQAKKKACENGVTRLKTNLFDSMKALNKKKIQTDLFTIAIQKNGGKAPVILDVQGTEELPDELVRIKEEPDMEAIRELIEKEGSCKYAHLGDRGESLRIK